MAALPHRVVLVTASSGGLGAEIARVFAADHRVVINYFSNKDKAVSLAKEFEQIPSSHPSPVEPRFHIVGGDASKKDDLSNLVDETIKTMGRLDYVISNAGWTAMLGWKSLEDNLDEDVWNRCFRANVMSHLWLMAAAKPHLAEAQGAFVTTASVAGVIPSGSSLPYSVTKAAQIHLAKGLAVLGGPSKIRVNSVAPGMLLTEWGQRFPEDRRQAYRESSRLKELPEVQVSFRTL